MLLVLLYVFTLNFTMLSKFALISMVKLIEMGKLINPQISKNGRFSCDNMIKQQFLDVPCGQDNILNQQDWPPILSYDTGIIK